MHHFDLNFLDRTLHLTSLTVDVEHVTYSGNTANCRPMTEVSWLQKVHPTSTHYKHIHLTLYIGFNIQQSNLSTTSSTRKLQNCLGYFTPISTPALITSCVQYNKTCGAYLDNQHKSTLVAFIPVVVALSSPSDKWTNDLLQKAHFIVIQISQWEVRSCMAELQATTSCLEIFWTTPLSLLVLYSYVIGLKILLKVLIRWALSLCTHGTMLSNMETLLFEY